MFRIIIIIIIIDLLCVPSSTPTHDASASRTIGVCTPIVFDMWTHKAERKKAAMRKAARARILGKRAAAAAAAKKARGGAAGGKGGPGRGRKPRVFRRAKRDCRVMDARRKKLGTFLFCGEIAVM